MSGVSVYIEMLQRAAGSAGAAGDTLSAIATRLRDRTTALDGAWGDDMYGAQFAETYLPARESLVTGTGGEPGAFPGLAKLFHDIEDAQRDGARALRRQENDNKARFRVDRMN
ncbi:hypothetical protein [Nocardia sp. X0981]